MRIEVKSREKSQTRFRVNSIELLRSHTADEIDVASSEKFTDLTLTRAPNTLKLPPPVATKAMRDSRKPMIDAIPKASAILSCHW